VINGENVRDGFRMIKLDKARLKELGAEELMPELAFSAEYHGGVDAQVFQQWDGKKWKTITEGIPPYEDVVWAEIRKSAQAYRQQVKN
jgi:branched-chain amino acid transport system substrate-binding protein